MNLLLYREIGSGMPDLPDFGPDFRAHMVAKRNPRVYRASLAAWSLLAEGLRKLGLPLYEVRFEAGGKPVFAEEKLFFSLSHSGSIAAALISTERCGVDVEEVREEISEKLFFRCMHPAEIEAGMNFFSVWTRKECIGKMNGKGINGRLCEVNSTNVHGGRWFERNVVDSKGRKYILTAVSENGEEIRTSC